MNNTQTSADWKKYSANKSINSVDMAMLALIKAVRAKSNDNVSVAKGLLYKSFTPIKKENRLANGHRPWQALEESIGHIAWCLKLSSKSLFGYENLSDAEKQQIINLVNILKNEKWEDITYTYIFVRQDLSPSQQVVQTAHCTMVLGQHINKHEYDASKLHFVVFGVPDYNELAENANRLEKNRIKLIKYFESDLSTNQLTSFACFPMRKSFAQRKKLFENNKLLTL